MILVTRSRPLRRLKLRMMKATATVHGQKAYIDGGVGDHEHKAHVGIRARGKAAELVDVSQP
jgi:hypothetical protein